MILSIASGKGGTGKTTIAVNMALSLAECNSQTAKRIQLLDCDVEEPNAHIFIKPEFTKKEPVTVPVPQVDMNTCNCCGKCQEVCQYNAIAAFKKLVLIFRELCHGCGGCSLLCPEKALTESEKVIGFLESGISKNLQFIHGKLDVGQTMSPPLIRVVKKQIEKSATVIIDAPPGTSCPVIEAIKGSTYCILVTEPTPFGMNDLILAVEVLRKLHIPFGVIINRAGLGNDEVETYCSDNDIPLLMKIPFDRRIAECYSKGIPMVEALPEYKKKFVELYEQISDGNLG
jgi:MinD superfamily P-loop ATPase